MPVYLEFNMAVPMIFSRRLLIAAALAFGLVSPAAGQGARGPLVLAAASLQESLTDAANAWAAQGHAKPVLSFAASSALAKQIDAGAPADLFISADEQWMDYVAAKKLIKPETRVSFLGNSLVLVSPGAKPLKIRIAPGFALARALGDSKLAMADPDAVPAGKYGKAALTKLGVWADLEPKVVRGENVRAALAFVARGEAAAGIVYATDAKAEKAVVITGTFPADSHPPITYPVGVLAGASHPDAEAFRVFLVSKSGKAIFARYGFVPR